MEAAKEVRQAAAKPRGAVRRPEVPAEVVLPTGLPAGTGRVLLAPSLEEIGGMRRPLATSGSDGQGSSESRLVWTVGASSGRVLSFDSRADNSGEVEGSAGL